MREVVEIVKKIANTSSTNDKIKIIKENKDNKTFIKVLQCAYNDNNYGFSLDKLIEGLNNYDNSVGTTWEDTFDMLDKLATSNINDSLRDCVYAHLMTKDEEVRDLIIKILSKDLRANISAKTINKAIKGCIVEFNVMLAESLFKQKENFINGREFIISTKLDGSRLVAIKRGNSVEFKTRQNKPMEGLKDIEEALLRYDGDFIFDGELLLKNENNLASDDLYRETMKESRKKGVKKNLIFNVFDCMSIDTFAKGYDKTPCIDRKENVRKIVKEIDSEWVSEVESLYIGNDESMIYKLLDETRALNQEGIMLNIANATYECKRSKNILKVKVMQTGDMRVINVIEGTGNNKGKLGSITVQFEHEGELHACDCGSGFLQDDRSLYWENPNLILGKIVEIQYFEISKNKQGGVGLRFPVFKAIRYDKDEISMH